MTAPMTTFRILRFETEFYMAGKEFPPDQGPTYYVPEIVIAGEGWCEFAAAPGVDPSLNRRKAKRALNRYRAFRNRHARTTDTQAPFHYV